MKQNNCKISDAEWLIMRVLWDQSPLTTTKIIETLSTETDWSPKTIHSLISRLVKKEALRVDKSCGQHKFYPLVAKEACIKENNFVQYINLLGLSKEKLLSTLNENPNPVDEGGLEFKKAAIRIWFDQKENTTVSQIFTQRADIDFNGVKIGDNINKFKKLLGEPISNKNGDMYFKYKDAAFISIIYDSNTNETQAVYFLRENF